MSEHDSDIDEGTWESLETLANTPVGRRWVLKAGLGSAASLVGGSLLASKARAATATPGSGTVGLHFAVGHVVGVTGLTLQAAGGEYPLVEHDGQSRSALRAQGGLWHTIDLGAVSHYVQSVPLPADRALLLIVVGRRGSRKVVVAQTWHTPKEAVLAFGRASQRLGARGLRRAVGSDARVARFGIRARDVTSPEELAQLETLVDEHTTAAALVMSHPDVSTINPKEATITRSLLRNTAEVTALGKSINSLQKRGEDPVEFNQILDPDGSPSQLVIAGKTVELDTLVLNRSNKAFVAATDDAVVAGMVAVQADPALVAVIDKPLESEKAASTKTVVKTAGVAPAATRYAPGVAAAAVTAGGGAAVAAAADRISVNVANPGFYFGTKTEVTGVDSSGNVDLKLYNNFVRWISVYLQYLGKDGENLSATKDSTFPRTKNCEYLGFLPQVFTVLGVPVWDQNSITVKLNFPAQATSARVMYCGLGGNILGGGWREYFTEHPYSDREIAPSEEVVIASVITAILCIALNVFALVSAIEISKAWASIKSEVASVMAEGRHFFPPIAYNVVLFADPVVREMFPSSVALTAGEGLAVGVSAGVSATTDKGVETGNLWKLLLGLASVIPKVLFSPSSFELWAQVGFKLGLLSGLEKAVQAVPVIGQVLAVASAAGNAATLAQSAVETALCPWVIANEVRRTYELEVTVNRDKDARTWPATARTWRLDTVIDGGAALNAGPVQGEINQGGKVQSQPLKLKLAMPFGGRTVKWTIVMMDENGNQVGTGASKEYSNNDARNVPGPVEFSITQLEVPITKETVFKRNGTTAYSLKDKGYTWSDKVKVDETRKSRGALDVMSAAIATRLGVAGVVWREDDHFFLRGVPVAQDGDTVTFGKVQKNRYARRPFLLFDPLVRQESNKTGEPRHVLLEPDPTEQSYHVRKLRLDPDTGAIAWDEKVSYGTFLLPITAAGLHPSGKVVALNSGNARIGVLDPVATDPPPLADYGAGPSLSSQSTVPGLLSSPVGLAVTNIGTVLILEAGVPRLSAFDFNLAPFKQFAVAGSDGFTLKLDGNKTYLDIAVDGAEQIYLLSHTGNGSNQDQYGIEVFAPTGKLINDTNGGVNVPHLAVDFWRSIFAPNYQPLAVLEDNKPKVDPLIGVIEPSVSRFDPLNPRKAG